MEFVAELLIINITRYTWSNSNYKLRGTNEKIFIPIHNNIVNLKYGLG